MLYISTSPESTVDAARKQSIKNAEKEFKITDSELQEISQILFEEDKSDLLSLVKINLQGYLNTSKATSNIQEDRAPSP